MSGPLRTDTSRANDPATDVERDAKVERLLLDGLDHYFAARHEQAINVWTRALFIDRSHARARAYIDRARSALAEQQRESEELLHSGIAAFNRGEPDQARRLLQDVLSRGAPSDEALSLLERLNRIEPGVAPARQPDPARTPRHRLTPAPAAQPRRRAAIAGVWLALAALLVTAGAWLTVAPGPAWRPSLAPAPGSTPAATQGVESVLPIPQRGETALARARALVASGRLRDALTSLDLVRPTDIQKADADRLRADIQRQLIALTVRPEGPRPEDPLNGGRER